MRVACVEKDPPLGGTCLNVGCIPSKALLDSSEHFALARDGLAVHGVQIGSVALDLPAMMARKEQIVRGLTQGIAGLFKKHKITRLAGMGRLVAPGRVAVAGADGETVVEATRVLARHRQRAHGAARPAVRRRAHRQLRPGDRAAAGAEAPAGGRRRRGRARARARCGAGSAPRCLVVEFLDRMVPWADATMVRQLQRALEKQGLAFRFSTKAESAERTADGVRVTLAGPGEPPVVDADVVLVAVGRRPFTEGLGARELGVAFDERGRIVVNERFETSVAGVYAVGDVIPGPMLAHKAEDDAVAAVEGMAGHAGARRLGARPERRLHDAGAGQRRDHRGAGQGTRARGTDRRSSPSRPTPGPAASARRRAG